MFIFERNSIGNEFKELVQKAAKDRKWWIFQFRPNDDARPIGDRKYKASAAFEEAKQPQIQSLFIFFLIFARRTSAHWQRFC